MKLINLQIIGNGQNGWSSDLLTFGNRITQLFGENGCGKTPIIQSIVFALGYKVEFHEDIVEHCDRVVLTVRVSGRMLTITRRIRAPSVLSVDVQENDGPAVDFFGEREFSNFLFSLWGVDNPVLTTAGAAPSQAYSSQIIPLFYLDQDRGYSEDYFIHSKFIKDQYSEVVRITFGLKPKNPFDRRRERIELKDRLEHLDRTVFRIQGIISELESEFSEARRPISDIDGDLRESIANLENLKKSSGDPQDVTTALDAEVARLLEQDRAIRRERSLVQARARGFAQIRNEINVEADTLSLNEEARRVFASFDAICANESCKLFVRSTESYGKSLLYLRDQMKDLERTNESSLQRIAEMDIKLSDLSSQIAAARRIRDEATARANTSTLIEAVASLTERIIKLRKYKGLEEELVRNERSYLERLQERDRVQAHLDSLESNRGVSDIEELRLRNGLRDRIKHWLGILRTSNVNLNIQVDVDFNVTFGGQKVSQFKGSTRTRVVLAIRTATFELAAQRQGSIPRFFILDTPRQQDISREDLANYISELGKLARSLDVQIVYSTTNHRYPLTSDDEEWLPRHPGEKHEMFLGSTSRV